MTNTMTAGLPDDVVGALEGCSASSAAVEGDEEASSGFCIDPPPSNCVSASIRGPSPTSPAPLLGAGVVPDPLPLVPLGVLGVFGELPVGVCGVELRPKNCETLCPT